MNLKFVQRLAINVTNFRFVSLVLVFSVLSFAIIAVGDFIRETVWPEGPLPPGTEAATGGKFSLITQQGRPVTETDFEDRHRLIFFGYTHCPDFCPITMQTVSEVLETLGPRADRMHALFITLDPDRDTPEMLAAYLENFDPGITGLTGTRDRIRAAARAYRVYYAKIPAGPPGAGDSDYGMDHSTALYFMAPGPRLIKAFAYDAPVEDIARAIAPYLAQEE